MFMFVTVYGLHIELLRKRNPVTFWGGVAEKELDLLVGGVLSQSTHDVGDLVVGHLVITHFVEESKGLSVVCSQEKGNSVFSCELQYGLMTTVSKDL